MFAEPLGVARRLTDDTEANTECLDRIDRLHYSEELLAAARDEGREWYRDLAVSMGTKLTADPEAVERVRAAVETTTGFHPTRLTALRDTAAETDAPACEDALARIEAAVSLQAALAERTNTATTSDAVMRGATRTLADHGRRRWNEIYPDIERVTVAGVSTLGATLADFLTALGRETGTDVEVHLYLRRATGPSIEDRLPTLCTVDTPGTTVIG